MVQNSVPKIRSKAPAWEGQAWMPNNAFAKINNNVVGCSIDSHFVHAEWTKKARKDGGLGPMKIPMLADTSKSISASFGCLIDEGDDAGIALRATYIIAPDGTIRHASLSDLPVGRNVDEVLRLVEAF